MEKPETAKECKRHPNHKLLPGICPSCLRERLQQFHDQSPNSIRSDSVSAFSSSSSSEFFFSGDSRRQRRHDHRRNASEMGIGSTATATATATAAADLFRGEKLKKSGSIGMLAAGGEKKNGGFWSRLFCRPKALYFHSGPKVYSYMFFF